MEGKKAMGLCLSKHGRLSDRYPQAEVCNLLLLLYLGWGLEGLTHLVCSAFNNVGIVMDISCLLSGVLFDCLLF